MKDCSTCGHSNPNANKICRECGSKFVNTNIDANKPSSNNSIFFIIGIAIIGVIIYMGSDSINKENNNYDDDKATTSSYIDKKILIKFYLKQNYLRDPDSYEPIAWSKLLFDTEKKLEYITHKFRAKNGFGGYNVESIKFYFDSDGNIVDSEEIDF